MGFLDGSYLQVPPATSSECPCWGGRGLEFCFSETKEKWVDLFQKPLVTGRDGKSPACLLGEEGPVH